MITGDLVKCNRTGSLGIVTRIVDANPNTGNTEWIYHVLWTESKHYGHPIHGGAMTWESLETMAPIPDEEYAA